MTESDTNHRDRSKPVAGWRVLLGMAVALAGNATAQADQALPGFTAPPMTQRAAAIPDSHPNVFTDRSRLQKLLSAHTVITDRALQRLQDRARAYVARLPSYTATYAGCDLDQYLKQFSYGDDSATSVAATLALYASLSGMRAGYGDDALAAQAAAGARAILLAWATTGMRDQGHLRSDFHRFCDAKGQYNSQTWLLVNLQIGRAMPDWVQAQDLLLGMNALDAQQQATLNAFVDPMFELIRTAANYKAATATVDCDRFNNQVSAGLLGMAAIARLRGNQAALMAVASGGNGQVLIPWTVQMQQNIYGAGESPRTCYGAAGDPHLYKELPTAAAGEVVDRYRAKEFQTFGYTLGSLEQLMLTASVLQRSGFDAVHYAGAHGQTMLTALTYYAHYFATYMDTSKAVVPPNSDPYPSYQQYVGKPVSRDGGATVDGRDGLITPFVIGAQMYPGDKAVLSVLNRAEHFSDRVTPLYGVEGMVLDDLADLPVPRRG